MVPPPYLVLFVICMILPFFVQVMPVPLDDVGTSHHIVMFVPALATILSETFTIGSEMSTQIINLYVQHVTICNGIALKFKFYYIIQKIQIRIQNNTVKLIVKQREHKGVSCHALWNWHFYTNLRFVKLMETFILQFAFRSNIWIHVLCVYCP